MVGENGHPMEWEELECFWDHHLGCITLRLVYGVELVSGLTVGHHFPRCVLIHGT